MSDKHRQTVIQSIPGLPNDCPVSLSPLLDAVKNNLETGIGVRTKPTGPNFDKWVRVRDLTDPDFWKSIGSPITSLFPPISGADNTPPGEPTNFIVTPGAWVNFLSWTNPGDEDFAYVEVWGGQTDDVLAATLLANVSYPADSWSHPLYEEFEQGWFYWVRAVDFYENKSDFVGDGAGGYEAPGPDSAGEMIDAVMAVLQGFKASYAIYNPAGTYYYGDRVIFAGADAIDRTYKCIVGGGGTITGIPPLDAVTGALDPNWTRSGILIEGDVDGVPTAGVDGNLVVDGTILARSIFVDYLSAIKADLGEITAGEIVISNDPVTPTNKLWFNESDDGCIAVGGTVKADAYFRVEADGSVTINDGGDICFFVDGAGGSSLIKWNAGVDLKYSMGMDYANERLCIYPYADYYGGFHVGTTITGNPQPFSRISLAAYDSVGIGASNVGGSILLDAATGKVVVSSPVLKPYAAATTDIGDASHKFKDLYLSGDIACDDIVCDDVSCDRVSIAGEVILPPAIYTTSNYSLLSTDFCVVCNGTADVVLTLPSASSYTGRVLLLKTIVAYTVRSASSNVVPLVGGAAGTSILAATAGKWAILMAGTTNWHIMAAN